MEFRGPGGLLGLLLIAVFIGFAVKQHRDQSKAEAWPTVQGTVTSVHLRDSRRIRHDQASNLHIVRSDVTYYIDLSYDYDVNGQHYSGNRTSRDSGSTSLDFAQAQMAKFDKGTPVTVHYNPANPAEAMVLR